MRGWRWGWHDVVGMLTLVPPWSWLSAMLSALPRLIVGREAVQMNTRFFVLSAPFGLVWFAQLEANRARDRETLRSRREVQDGKPVGGGDVWATGWRRWRWWRWWRWWCRRWWCRRWWWQLGSLDGRSTPARPSTVRLCTQVVVVTSVTAAVGMHFQGVAGAK